MALKKQNFSDDEIAIFDEAIIYKRGEYWHFRMWLNGENKYARKSLKTRSKSTAIERGKETYLEIFANQKIGKKYFSITTKEGVEKYLAHREKDVVSGLIVKGRLGTIKTHLQHWLNFIGKDTKLKELEQTDCEDYFHQRVKQRNNVSIKQVTIQNEQSSINSMMKWLFRNNETHIDSFEFRKLPRIDRNNEEIRRSTFEEDEFQKLTAVMSSYCKRRQNKLDANEWKIRQLVRHYILIAASSGMRVGEQRQLRWSDVVYTNAITENRQYHLMSEIRVRAETSKVRASRKVVCKGGEYFERLRRVLGPADEDGLIFSLDGKTVLSNRSVLYHFHKMVDLCELEGREQRDLVPYSLRHYFITQKIMSGLTYRQIADMCGTSASQIENTYYHVNDEILYSHALADYRDDGSEVVFKENH
jgi:site-specific recombinase XerD